MTVEDVMEKIRNAERIFKHLTSKVDLSDEEDITVDILVDYMEILRNLKVRDI